MYVDRDAYTAGPLIAPFPPLNTNAPDRTQVPAKLHLILWISLILSIGRGKFKVTVPSILKPLFTCFSMISSYNRSWTIWHLCSVINFRRELPRTPNTVQGPDKICLTFNTDSTERDYSNSFIPYSTLYVSQYNSSLQPLMGSFRRPLLSIQVASFHRPYATTPHAFLLDLHPDQRGITVTALFHTRPYLCVSQYDSSLQPLIDSF